MTEDEWDALLELKEKLEETVFGLLPLWLEDSEDYPLERARFFDEITRVEEGYVRVEGDETWSYCGREHLSVDIPKGFLLDPAVREEHRQGAHKRDRERREKKEQQRRERREKKEQQRKDRALALRKKAEEMLRKAEQIEQESGQSGA